MSNSIIEPLVLLLFEIVFFYSKQMVQVQFLNVKLHPNVQAIINRMFNLFTHAASTREKNECGEHCATTIVKRNQVKKKKKRKRMKVLCLFVYYLVL